MRICVVGAGAAGLCAAYNLQKQGIEHVVYEQTDVPSGQWVYREHDPEAHSSMYRDLNTNLPVEAMAYPGIPYPKGVTRYVHHTIIRAYLDAFYREYVAPHGNVHFNTKVIRMIRRQRTPSEDDPLKSTSSWEVEVKNLESELVHKENFTHVMVCNGRYSVPRFPEVPGSESFTGVIEHSHGYRIPEKYAGKRVVVVGAGFSGIDICLEIVKVAKECVISHRKEQPLNLPGVVERGSLTRIQGNRVYFGSEDFIDEVDYLMFCTGYLISMPFLTKDSYVTIEEGHRIRDLFRHCILISDPSVVFIGLPSRVTHNLLFDYQIRYVIGLFTGTIPLLSEEQMRKEVEEDERQRNEVGLGALKFAHDLLSPLLWRYLQKFVDDGLGSFDPIYVSGYEKAHCSRRQNPAGFRNELINLDGHGQC